MARAVASPTAAASVRIFFIRASGANGLPFWMPMDAQKPSVVGSTESVGSSCTTSFNISQNR